MKGGFLFVFLLVLKVGLQKCQLFYLRTDEYCLQERVRKQL